MSRYYGAALGPSLARVGALAAVVGDNGAESQASLSHYGARRAHARQWRRRLGVNA